MNISRLLIATAIAAISAGPLFAVDLVDDAALTAKVKMALIANPVTKARQIEVDSKSGTVALSGFVDTATARDEATIVAKSVNGVVKVDNNLELRGADRTAGAVVDDAVITAKVKTALLEDTATKGLKINIETREGTVQLNGFTSSANEKNVAEKLAASVTGVKTVHNNLTVKN